MLLVVLLALLGYLVVSRSSSVESHSVGIANPASTNCVNLSGRLEIVTETDGQVGYCHLPDGRVCEEWSLMRGGCTQPK